MFWWQWYWWYLTRSFFETQTGKSNLWFYGTVFENFVVSLGANKIPLFNEVWSKVGGSYSIFLILAISLNLRWQTRTISILKPFPFPDYISSVKLTYDVYRFFFTFDDSHLYQIAKFCKRVYLFTTKGHNIVLLLHRINVCSRFMLNTTVFCICLRCCSFITN